MVLMPEEEAAAAAAAADDAAPADDARQLESQALRESIQRKIEHAEGVLIPTLGAAPSSPTAAAAAAATAAAAGLDEGDWEGDGPMPMEVLAVTGSEGEESAASDAEDPEAAPAAGHAAPLDVRASVESVGSTASSATAELPADEPEGDDAELRFELEAGLKDPAAVYTELLRDYSQFLTELGQVAADGQASEDTLKQLDMLDENAHGLLLELDAGVEAITAAAAAGTLRMQERHAELVQQAALLGASVGATVRGAAEASTSPSRAAPPARQAPSPTPAELRAEEMLVSAPSDSSPVQRLPPARAPGEHPKAVGTESVNTRSPQKSRHESVAAAQSAYQGATRSRRTGPKRAPSAEDERLTAAYTRQRSNNRARMAEARSNAMAAAGGTGRFVRREALNTRNSFNKAATKRGDKTSNPKMLTKKMVMQELLLEMHKKWRTMKFVPDTKLNAARTTLRGQDRAAQQRSLEALVASSAEPQDGSPGGPGPMGGVSAAPGEPASRRQRRGGKGGSKLRLNDPGRMPAPGVRSGPPGPPGLARRRPKAQTVQRAADLIESRAVKYDQVMDRMRNANRGNRAPRMIRKSNLGGGSPTSSPRKKGGRKAAPSPYNVGVRNPSDPLGILAKTGGGLRRATPSFAAPVKRGEGQRVMRGGGEKPRGRGASRGASPSLSSRRAPGSPLRPSPSKQPDAGAPAVDLEDERPPSSGLVAGAEEQAAADSEGAEASGDEAAPSAADGVANRDALAAAMEAERRQLAQMFDDVDATSGAQSILPFTCGLPYERSHRSNWCTLTDVIAYARRWGIGRGGARDNRGRHGRAGARHRAAASVGRRYERPRRPG